RRSPRCTASPTRSASRCRSWSRRCAPGTQRPWGRPRPSCRATRRSHSSPTATGSATATALVVPLRSAATTPMITIAATETIAALEDLLPQSWPTAEGPLEELLTLAHLTGEDRALTTAIATALRDEVTLDDGTLPLGIRFLSKHGHPAQGTGTCWAYWMRYVDRGLDE